MDSFFDELHQCLLTVKPDVLESMASVLKKARRVLIIGNGGSAAIASHIAVDYTKNAGKQAMAFNDISLITCFANDFGYENFFEKAIAYHSGPGDALIAISSSGKSLNILNAVRFANDLKLPVATLSGFNPDNPLRKLGLVNIYINSDDYGLVEISHLAVLHSMVAKISVIAANQCGDLP